mgnify:CR=1 FL=1
MTEEKSGPDYIKVEGPDVFFYCDVSVDSVAELCTAVKKIERDYYGTIVRVHIHSDGGDLHAGLAAMDFLRSCKSHIVTIAEGMCASAATFIFLGGDKRIVEPNAYLLIHQLGSDFWGKYEDMKDEMKQCDRLMKRMKKIYLCETSLPESKLNKLMKRDLYLSHRQCVKYNIHVE